MRRGLGLFVRGAASAALGAATLASLALQAPGAGAAPAQDSGGSGNPYSPAYGHPYRHGAVPTVEQNNKMHGYAATHPSSNLSSLSTGPETLSYGGGIDGIGVTSSTPKVYLVFWGTQWGTAGRDTNGNTTFSNDPSGGAPYLQKLFKGLGTGSEGWSGTMTQYCDGPLVATGATSCPSGAPHIAYPTGGDLAGVWYDNSAAEPPAASGHQIGVEAVNAAAHFQNTTAASNRDAQYVILSATGLNPDNYQTQGFCAWHDYNGDSTLSGGGVSSPYGDIAFTNMPYVMDAGASCGQGFVNSPGTLDGYSIVEGHEYAETVTDQNPAGGWTNHQLNSYNGQENGDECAWISLGQGASTNVSTGTGTFAMQSTWSNDTNRCDITHAIVGAPANDFSMLANPASGSVTAGNSVGTTVSTSVTSGVSQSVTLSTSGAPAGTTVTYGSNPIASGGSTTVSFLTPSSAPGGNYTVTITGTGASATHSTTFTMSVTALPGANVINNGDFQTGNLSGWTSAGVTSMFSPGHNSTWAGEAGASTPTSGNSSLAQTFTAATGDSTLTFWYDVTCTGKLRYEWATATLRDNTTGVTSTILQRTCVANSGWQMVTAALTAGHSYTLTLINRDDNRAGDPAHTLFDDVSTS